MNKAMNKRNSFIYIIIIIVSLLLLLLGIYYLINENSYGKNGDEVDAIVWNILDHPDSSSPTYEADLKEYNTKLKYYRDLGYMSETSIVAIFIKYNHNNKEYITELGYFSPEIRIGQSVKILVSKDDSTDFIVKEKKHFALIFCLITGSIGLIGGVLFLFANKHNSKVIDYLKQTGTLYECEILFVDEDEKKVSFERHPFIFTCRYIDEETKEEKIFTSDSTFVRNGATSYIGKKVNVYVDKKYDNNYYVDLKKFEDE